MRRVLVAAAFAALAAGGGLGAAFMPSGSHAAAPKHAIGIHKIKHVIVIRQENGSFDHYFGTYPGTAGFPRNHAQPRPAHRQVQGRRS
jgi:phospholipase C